MRFAHPVEACRFLAPVAGASAPRAACGQASNHLLRLGSSIAIKKHIPCRDVFLLASYDNFDAVSKGFNFAAMVSFVVVGFHLTILCPSN